MAIIHSNPNGKLRGRLGPLYAKIVNGRNIFCIMPAPQGKMTDEMIQKLERLRQFRATARFASALVKIPAVKELNEQIKGHYYSAFTALTSKNYHLSGVDYPKETNIVAINGFAYDLSSSQLSSTSLSASCPAMNAFTEIPDGASKVTFAGTILFTNPNIEGSDPFVVTRLVKEVTGYNFTSAYSLTHSLDTYQQRMASAYANSYAIFTLIVQDADGKILKNSKSISVVGE